MATKGQGNTHHGIIISQFEDLDWVLATETERSVRVTPTVDINSVQELLQKMQNVSKFETNDGKQYRVSVSPGDFANALIKLNEARARQNLMKSDSKQQEANDADLG